MLKKFKVYFEENMEMIAAGMATMSSLNFGTHNPYMDL